MLAVCVDDVIFFACMQPDIGTFISTFKDELIVDDNGIDGLPEDYKKTRLQEDGTYIDDVEIWLAGVEDKAAQIYPKVLRQSRPSTQRSCVHGSSMMQ